MNLKNVNLDKRKETRKDSKQSQMPIKKQRDLGEKLQLSKQSSRKKRESLPKRKKKNPIGLERSLRRKPRSTLKGFK